MNQELDELLKKVRKQKQLSLQEIDKEEVNDIREIKLTRKKSSKQRILDFLNEVKNPYFFKIDGYIVQIAFNDKSELSADDCLYNSLKDFYR